MRKFVILAVLTLIGCANAFAIVPHAESVSGEVVIRSVGPRHIVVFVDSHQGGRSGLIDQWFILESPEPIDETLSMRFAGANLVHYPGNLRISVAREQKLFEFVVPDYDEGRPMPNGFSVTRYTGIGLSHVVHDSPDRMDSIQGVAGRCADGTNCPPDLDWYVDDGSGGGGTSCDSGGAGANQCSVTSGTSSCNVTCNSGYYACCQATTGLPTCKCVRG